MGSHARAAPSATAPCTLHHRCGQRPVAAVLALRKPNARSRVPRSVPRDSGVSGEGKPPWGLGRLAHGIAMSPTTRESDGRARVSSGCGTVTCYNVSTTTRQAVKGPCTPRSVNLFLDCFTRAHGLCDVELLVGPYFPWAVNTVSIGVTYNASWSCCYRINQLITREC